MGNKPNEGNPAHYTEEYKITFDGFIKVGKTTLIKKYLEGKEYNESHDSFCASYYTIFTFGFPKEGRNIGISIYDCSINENFLVAAAYVCRRTDVFIFIYDITKKSSFLLIKKKSQNIKKNSKKKMP